ncbi:unnamed protein product [Plutella xylostella]|uniref:(diamondback moth) hypothetical protein n=1 Tax=Plutella xylostella TaxID=51655 RepID=A0A8S4G793_PLUXY|nr:unnamed protein product [Plutella xylostella]
MMTHFAELNCSLLRSLHSTTRSMSCCSLSQSARELTRSCYKFHQVRRNWTRAFMTCAAEGAHLAIINSEAEAKHLTTMFPPEGGTLELDLAHLGFQDYGERGVWRTIHGETIQNTTYEVWAGPDNAPPGEYCGSMFRNGKLNDVWCDRSFYFICEKDPKSLLCDDDLYQIQAL